MTPNETLKMELLREFKDVKFCRLAYAFIKEDDKKEKTFDEVMPDGVYFRYTDGSFGKDLDASKTANYVGVKMGERTIAVTLADFKDVTLTSGKDETTGHNYISDWDEANTDFNGAENTEHLKAIGLGDGIELSEGDWIPSLGELRLIHLFKKDINAALSKIGGEPLADDWYWTSTEYSSTNAWFLLLSNGLQSHYSKSTIQDRVRAVSTFI